MPVITIHSAGNSVDIPFSRYANLLSLLRDNGYPLDATCGGNGTCGKCTVRIRRNDKIEVVRACSTILEDNCEVWLTEPEADLSWNESLPISNLKSHDSENRRAGFGAAVDLGTTTVALKLFRLSDGTCIGSISRWNCQKSYGADVITRISYCMDNEDGLNLLSSIIRSQIISMLKDVCNTHGIAVCDVKEIFLAGNTVMQHIFAGISPVSIASAPFKPLSLFEDTASSIILDKIPVFMAPCVAGYVGGDITSGILSIGMNKKNEKSLFIDVGTNGEMAIGNSGGFTSCAVASGPAFEGAGIECGMPAAHGAVNKVDICDGRLVFDVLGGIEPKGICGSGILDLVSCLLQLGYIDESGYLEENENGEQIFYLADNVFISQRDIRQIQLAKAAVAAGIKILLKSENLDYSDIDCLYLAGGFGNRLRPESAIRIGMLPPEMSGKIKAAGNTSLSGAELCLLSSSFRNELSEIKNKCKYIELSSSAAFSECFVDEMIFPEE